MGTLFLRVTGSDVIIKPITTLNQANQVLGHQLCDSAITSALPVGLLLQHADALVCGKQPQISIFVTSQWCVDTKCRFKYVTYHDVCDMMGYHIQCYCCYMIIEVCFFMFVQKHS